MVMAAKKLIKDPDISETDNLDLNDRKTKNPHSNCKFVDANKIEITHSLPESSNMSAASATMQNTLNGSQLKIMF